MEVPLLAVGISLILTGIVDVFFTVLHPDGFGFLSSRLYKGLFASMRVLTRPLPPRFRALGLSMAAPLMVPMIITVWIALVLAGYALIYYAGMTSESFNFSSPGLEPSLGEALYISGTAISTLGFGDVTPADGLYQTLAVSEALKRYPVLYYYHSRRAYRSVPYTFRMIGGVAGALRWGLSKDHPAGQSPWLPTLITGVDMMTSYIDERFLSESLEMAPEPVPFETFEAAFERGKEPSDPWLERFFEMQLYMRDLVRTQDSVDPKECYERYKEWLPFAHRNRAFFEATARELGYGLEELDRNPGDRLF